MIKAVIFDVDGTICDSEPFHKLARDRVLKDYSLDVEYWSPKALYRGKREYWAEVIDATGINIDVESLVKKEFDQIVELVIERNLKPSKNLVELLEFLKGENIIIGIGSSSDLSYVQNIIKALGIDKYFSVISCGDMVQFAKPAPDIFLKALDMAKVSSEQALVIEDSLTGVKAGHNANIKCVGYDVASGEYKQDLSVCEFVVNDMIQIIDIIKELNA